MFDIEERESADLELQTEYRSFVVRPLTPHIGAEVRSIDLSENLSEEQLSDISQAWLDWKVLVFRGQILNRDQHRAFARRFGELYIHPLKQFLGIDPDIHIAKTTKSSLYTSGNFWHSDITCDVIPPFGSMLYLTVTPKSGGGDTLFADMYLAYEMLSQPIRAFLEKLEAIHDGASLFAKSFRHKDAAPRLKNTHPVVITHPQSGRKALYVNQAFTSHISGLRKSESEAILSMLYAHINSTPRLWCRVEWEPNTLTIWDNRCTQHHAVWDYFPHSRYGERISVVDGKRPQS